MKKLFKVQNKSVSFFEEKIVKNKKIPTNIKKFQKKIVKRVNKILKLKVKPKIYYNITDSHEYLGCYYCIKNKRPIIVIYLSSIYKSWEEMMDSIPKEDCTAQTAKEIMQELLGRVILHEMLHYKFEKDNYCWFLNAEEEEEFVLNLEDKIWKMLCIG